MTRDLATLSVLVTGGARGIGRATAERLARQGARVAIGDLDADLVRAVAAEISASPAVVAAGGRVVGAELDVTERDSWDAFLAATADLGPVDVLVNNAGIMPLGPLLEEPEALTRKIVDVNLHGIIHGTKAVVPAMIGRGGGHVINVASAVGRVPLPNGATYSASKFAAVGFSEALRGELAPLGVQVTAVLPNVVRTELGAGVPAARGVKAVTAEDVAAVIESAIHKPRPELWVPRYAQVIAKGALVLPQRVQDAMARLIKADKVLSSADHEARAAYEARVRTQH
ncbi:SDR family oxidoreductase [Nocardioides sp. zg-DK7169]|uniref:SDR family oxidoreductase n=1 Tax=Nocardioides sp. zg-DK7169 TaxID=2736600 RepID=UPI0015576A72|nr:SDR family oxidoreductase [Nocardioides sp. zg-DK7169]NPC97573.1 SDR family oxidoreductase [Nocardioides sp. zg-DK7169]